MPGDRKTGAVSTAQGNLIPRRGKLAVVGDSYQGQNYNLITGAGRNFTLNGSVAFLNVLASQAFNIDIDHAFFTAGSSGTEFILSQLPAIVLYKPDFLVFCAGHNDINQGLSLNKIQQNFISIIDILASADITPIMCLTGPQNTVQGSRFVTLRQAQRMIILLNDWKRAYATASGLLLWDWFTPMVDPGSGGYADGMSYDEIHPGFKAAYRVAKQGLIDLASIIPPPTTALQVDQADDGNLVPDALFSASGAKISEPATGTGPAGWSILRYNGTASGGKIVNSLIPSLDDLGTWNRVCVGGNTKSGTKNEELGFCLPIFAGPTTYRSGDVLEAWLEIEVAGNSPFNGVLFSIGDHNGVTLLRQSTNGGHVNRGETTGPLEQWSGILYCPKLTISPASENGKQFLMVQVIPRWDASGNNFSGEFRFRRPTVRKAYGAKACHSEDR